MLIRLAYFCIMTVNYQVAKSIECNPRQICFNRDRTMLTKLGYTTIYFKRNVLGEKTSLADS